MVTKVVHRMLCAVSLAGFTLFSIFGFLATFEYSDLSQRLPWQILYGVVGVINVAGLILLVKSSGPKSHA